MGEKAGLPMRLFDNDGKAVAMVEMVDDSLFEAKVHGKPIGTYRDLLSAMRAVHREFKLPDFEEFKEIFGELEPIKDKPDEFFYGGRGTIHDSGEVNVERDPTTGFVVAVWFRCMTLPFTDTIADKARSEEMRRAYHRRLVGFRLDQEAHYPKGVSPIVGITFAEKPK
jgi:hypothetical protein